MKFALIVCSFLVGATLVLNVDSTCLKGLLLGGCGHDHLHPGLHPFPGLEIFHEFFNLKKKIFAAKKDGFNHFLDGCSKGVPALLEKLCGHGKIGTFLGPLSEIPDDADLHSLLGKKLEAKAEIFALLIQLAKKYCINQKCEKLPIEKRPGGDSHNIKSGEDFRKALTNFLNSHDKKFEGGLEDFHSGFEGLISSLEPSKEKEIFHCLSKLPEHHDPSVILGKDASHSEGGIFCRKDILPILVKFAKSKCTKGCGKS